MIRTGDEYRESIRDGREVWIDGEQVKNVSTRPSFKPIVDLRARIYDLAHQERRATFVITDEQIEWIVPVLDQSIGRVASELGS